MSAGETLFLAQRRDIEEFLFIVTPSDSSIVSQLKWLFGFDEQIALKFGATSYSANNATPLDFVTRLVLEEIGIELEDPESNTIESIVAKFGFAFPNTKEFSALARQTLPNVDPTGNPDQAIIAWLNHEDLMFRSMERKIIEKRINDGFNDENGVNVDEFLKYSKPVHQRRYSRMGYSLEHHLDAIFCTFNLKFSRKAHTENKSKPEFLFPGESQYWDKEYPIEKLAMLGSKSTCKDRWRQLLSEAAKVQERHLFTLEPSISENQTNEMQAHNIQLIFAKKHSLIIQTGTAKLVIGFT